MDWRFGREIRRDLEFLRSLCNYLNSLHSLFMKDFALTGRSTWIFLFFHFVDVRQMSLEFHFLFE
jgi:hypothetical protein